MQEWYNSLEDRFKDLPSKLLSLLEQVRYTIRDIRNRKDPIDYINTIVLNAKNARIATTEAAQVLMIYKYIDAKLRRDLLLPSLVLTIS